MAIGQRRATPQNDSRSRERGRSDRFRSRQVMLAKYSAAASVRGGVVDDGHGIACVAVVEPDSAHTDIGLERGVVTGSTSTSTARRAVAIVGQPALRSAGRRRSHEVGRRAVRRVKGGAAARLEDRLRPVARRSAAAADESVIDCAQYRLVLDAAARLADTDVEVLRLEAWKQLSVAEVAAWPRSTEPSTTT